MSLVFDGTGTMRPRRPGEEKSYSTSFVVAAIITMVIFAVGLALYGVLKRAVHRVARFGHTFV